MRPNTPPSEVNVIYVPLASPQTPLRWWCLLPSARHYSTHVHFLFLFLTVVSLILKKWITRENDEYRIIGAKMFMSEEWWKSDAACWIGLHMRRTVCSITDSLRFILNPFFDGYRHKDEETMIARDPKNIVTKRPFE